VFFLHLLALFIIKKIDDHIIKFNLKKKKYLAKPANRDNQGYLAKITNQIIEST
jgi:hypothetical protein